MRTLAQDARFALRQFLKTPGFAVSAVLSLMLGIGATTAIFSVVYGVLLDPYPYKDANRMVHVELRDKNGRGPLLIVNGSQAPELRKASVVDDVFLQDEKGKTLPVTNFPSPSSSGSIPQTCSSTWASRRSLAVNSHPLMPRAGIPPLSLS